MDGVAAVPLRIRPGMDVFSAYQNQYIGTVIRVWPGKRAASGTENSARETGSTIEAVRGNPPLQAEGGAAVSPTAHIGSKTLGEELGPFPTEALGNDGPINQSAARKYGTGGSEPDVVLFAVRPGRINLGPLTPPLYIPTAAVRSVSMARVILDVQRDQIPPEWRQAPHVV
ncbi:MAG TPA: hypothetical protein VFA78_05290 [Chloroflexota bacterium]|nr:hypothetical protein [Chloroflexota bacterium]